MALKRVPRRLGYRMIAMILLPSHLCVDDLIQPALLILRTDVLKLMQKKGLV